MPDDLVGTFVSDTPATITIAKNGDFELSIERLTQISGSASAAKAGYVVLDGTDASGAPIGFEFGTLDGAWQLVVVSSSWDLLPNGTSFRFVPEGQLKPAPAASDFVIMLPDDLMFDTLPKAVAVSPVAAAAGMGEITVKYYREGELLSGAPVDAGSYSFRIDVAEGEAYRAVSDLTAADWNFTVTPAYVYEATGKLDNDVLVYTGGELCPELAIVIDERTRDTTMTPMVEGKDFVITEKHWINNVEVNQLDGADDAGWPTAIFVLQGIGNYQSTASLYLWFSIVPAEEPAPAPTAEPTAEPTVAPTAVPTAVPTVAPTAEPEPTKEEVLLTEIRDLLAKK